MIQIEYQKSLPTPSQEYIKQQYPVILTNNFERRSTCVYEEVTMQALFVVVN
jgi:hypothetical protein